MGRGLFLSLCGLLSAFVMEPVMAQDADFLIIAHRGASGERPEHTLASYERAIDQGADYVEPDLVVTKDLVLVARHENEISETTDVASREEFDDRRRTKEIDGRLVSGWFAEDFTLAELRSLRARERLPGLRRANTRFDGLYQIPTFDEIVQLVRAKEAESGRRIGIYPELKHPMFLLQESGIDTVDLLVTSLRNHQLDTADSPIFVQCFEVGPLRRLSKMVDVPLIQLINPQGGPADEPAMTYAEMLSESGLAEIASYAKGIGPGLELMVSNEGTPTPALALAKAAGLAVHPWTLRKENAFLPPMARLPGGEGDPGNLAMLVKIMVEAGIDGVFADDPALVAAALDR